MNDAKPNPCRYCGSRHIIRLYGESTCCERRWGHRYKCKTCGHAGPVETDAKCALMAWNEVN